MVEIYGNLGLGIVANTTVDQDGACGVDNMLHAAMDGASLR